MHCEESERQVVKPRLNFTFLEQIARIVPGANTVGWPIAYAKITNDSDDGFPKDANEELENDMICARTT
jgi:hypothetical protein